ncbi:MAG: hypothetical protein ACE10G_04320 [Gemmatimonadales bacterium]
MSAGKSPGRDKRKDAAIVDGLLEDLFFSDPGSKEKSGKQPRPSGSAPKPISQPRPSGSAPKPISQSRPSGSAPRPISQMRPSGSAPMPISQRRPSAPSFAQPGGNARAGTWGRISLGVLIAVAMLQWPYDHSCGLDLGFYLTAVAMVLVSAGWGSACSWKNRMPVAHSVSQILLLWGFVLGAGQVLPRVGYAKDLATWRCVAGPAPAPAPAAVAPAIVPSISREADVVNEAIIPAE